MSRRNSQRMRGKIRYSSPLYKRHLEDMSMGL